MTKDKKKVLDKDTNDIQNKRKKSHSVTSKKKYELINYLSETRDSISATPIGNPCSGEAYYSENIVREMIREIIRQELTAAGVLKEV